MKNIEKYQEELAKLMVESHRFAVTKKGNVVGCFDINCDDCIFKRELACIARTKEGRKEWAYSEYKEPILDDVEREYLRAVIKPFRNQVKYIQKCRDDTGEFVEINYKENLEIIQKTCLLFFPYFKVGTMYKGMEVDKEYSIEELGL